MGAGAGYEVEVKDCKFTDIRSLTVTEVNDGLISVDCDADMLGSVKASSYYYGCDWVADVPMKIAHMDLNLGELFDGYGYNVDPEMLTPEAADRILNELITELDYNAETIGDVYFDEDFTSRLLAEDINTEAVKNALLDRFFSISGKASLGGGWTHSTFSGIFTIEVNRSYYDESYTIEITDKYVIEYLDKAVTGDNKFYDAVYNGEIIESFDDEKGAIEYLKNEIMEALTSGAADTIYPDDCYVEEAEYIMLNGKGDGDVNYDYSQIVYKASEDPDFDFGAVIDTIEELNEEDDVGVDEGFDM